MRVCEVCESEFEPPVTAKGRISARRTCSDSCRAALTWVSSGSRSESISAAQKKRSASIVEWNHKRWARPGEREKLSERNRQAWADPSTRQQLSAAIAARQGTPEMRQFYSEMRAACWRDPVYRARVTEIIRASHQTPKYRELFSELLRARWQIPYYRERYTAGIRRTTRSPKMRELQRERMLAVWARKRAHEVVRPPITERPLVRPPLPAPKCFSMFGEKMLKREGPVWRRLDLVF